MVTGSPGGRTIINTVLLTILNVVDFGMNAQEAVDAPRFHHQWLPDVIRYERYGLASDVRALLEGRGHRSRTCARRASPRSSSGTRRTRCGRVAWTAGLPTAARPAGSLRPVSVA